MISERLQKLSVRLREWQVEHALLSSLASLRYFTGHTTPIEWGPSPFTPLNGMFLWLRDEKPKVFLADTEPAGDVGPQLTLQLFASYTIEEPLPGLQDLIAKLVENLKQLPKSLVGIEAQDLPAAVLEALRSACTQLQFEDVSPLLRESGLSRTARRFSSFARLLASATSALSSPRSWLARA